MEAVLRRVRTAITSPIFVRILMSYLYQPLLPWRTKGRAQPRKRDEKRLIRLICVPAIRDRTSHWETQVREVRKGEKEKGLERNMIFVIVS